MKRTGKATTAREREARTAQARFASLARHALCLVLAPLFAGCATSQSIELPSAPVGPVPLVPGPGTPRVHLQLNPPDTSFPGVELREVAGWELQEFKTSTQISATSGARLVPGSRGLCPVPCGVIIDGRGDHQFFFSGPGIHTSKHFQLATESGDLLFKVTPGSQGQWRAGELTTVAGGGLLVIGAGVLTLASVEDSSVHKKGRFIPGASILGLGAALVGVGVTLLLTSRTSYSLQRTQASSQPLRWP
jgi:hypothetical protein